MPERQYKIRGSTVFVEEIPNLVAVKLELSADEVVAEHQREAALVALGGEIPPDVADSELAAFTAARWVFVRPPAGGLPGLPPEVEASHVGRVFQRPGGRLLIGTDRLTVKLKPALSPAQALGLLVAEGLEVIRQIRFARNAYEIEVPPRRDFIDVAHELNQRDEFVYAEPEMVQHMGQRRRTPKDPRYPLQWQWHPLRPGGADIGAEVAWTLAQGSGIRIAVIDLGFEVSHPDLSSAIAAESGYFERRGIDAVFVPGTTNIPQDDHGTFCAGMAAARVDNAEGGCGMAPLAELMVVACLDPLAVGSEATLARAVAYAADPSTESPRASSQNGADVITCSVGPDDGDWELESQLNEALEFVCREGRNQLGVPVFWAVGNDYRPVSSDPVASHRCVIPVGCSTETDHAAGTAHGAKLEFLAPGVGVYSTMAGRTYNYDTGTSFAAPCAAGIAALVLERYPALTWQQVRQRLRDTCDKIGGVNYKNGRHKHYGFGRLNAGKAVL